MNFAIKTTDHPLCEELQNLFMGMPILKIENMEDHRYRITVLGKFCSVSIVLEHGEVDTPKSVNDYVTSTPLNPPIKKGEWRVPFPNSQTQVQMASLYQLEDVKNLIWNLELGHRIEKENT